ncbi:MAG: NAD-dependent epimerase/dehydratase family protein [Betaproteobacteria bacterium]|nr:MAG: NAD-dependent epimerase/dehydratase family protein [Betaproteobacteria bacterium]
MTAAGPVVVTGATGFVGSGIVRAFLATGYPVRALVRAASPLANLAGLEVESACADICDRDAVARAMAGVRHVVHAAADYRLWARDPDALVRTNVEGTRTVMEAALRAGIERVVYTSSVATLALRPDGEAADETVQLAATAAVGAYKRSKIVAEQLVQTMIARDALPAVIVNPSTPVGPRDIRPTPTGRIIVEAASGHMPGFLDVGLNIVHVDDVAAGIGERYILGGDNVLLEHMLRDIAGLVGRRPPRLKLMRGPLYPIAAAAEIIAAMTGREPFLTLDGLRMSRHHMFFTSAKAERELGFNSRPYAEGLRDAVDWFRRAGYLR